MIILKTEEEQIYLKNLQLGPANVLIKILIIHEYTRFSKGSLASNFLEGARMLKSLPTIYNLCLKNKFATITISEVDPEKYFYLMWLPFIRVVYVLHSEPDELASSFTRFSANFLLGRRKKIITVSKSNRDKLIRNWKISKRAAKYVHMIYNTAGRAYNNSAQDLKAPGSQKIVLTLAHVVHYKNPEVWLKVAQRVTALRPDVSFLWLGNGQLFDYFRTLTAENDRIKFAGFVEDPSDYLDKALVYYQPSLKESQGIGVLEAMASGLPCVVSSVGGLPESVLNGCNGFVTEPNDIEKQIMDILKLIDDPELHRDFGLRSASRYEQLFSTQRFLRQMDSVYRPS